jgi:hypothetical protein
MERRPYYGNTIGDEASAHLQLETFIFRWIEKRTKKITATRDDPQGAPVKTRADVGSRSAHGMTFGP